MPSTDNQKMESSGEGTSNNQAPVRGERKSSRGSRQKAVDNLSKKFLRNFDPEHSEREKRKLYRRLYQSFRKHLYNDVGIFIQTSDDLCDCLDLDCPGCHFACPKCSSHKCGHDCRNNRKWTYDNIQCEGTDAVIKNPLLKEGEIK
ncbi:ARL14 effector protein [Solenopsis invicta]|uniref:ARL14 effector protein n=1 Tax=Solenopsis invicta TaxID=13686 RepID=UPI0005963CB2|nr:ARL14 effector protein [Solenopsis invicta]XP_011158440.1 ARL14 effector protein [Solenopsis invicta]XP_025991386.1 ARL14 effector protein [Solenopsis invicta]